MPLRSSIRDRNTTAMAPHVTPWATHPWSQLRPCGMAPPILRGQHQICCLPTHSSQGLGSQPTSDLYWQDIALREPEGHSQRHSSTTPPSPICVTDPCRMLSMSVALLLFILAHFMSSTRARIPRGSEICSIILWYTLQSRHWATFPVNTSKTIPNWTGETKNTFPDLQSQRFWVCLFFFFHSNEKMVFDLSLFPYASGHPIIPCGLPALGKVLWYLGAGKTIIEKKKQDPDPYEAIYSNQNLGQQFFEVFPLGRRRGELRIQTAAREQVCIHSRAWTMYSHGKTTQEWLQRAHQALGHGRPLVTRTRLASRGLLQSLLRVIIRVSVPFCLGYFDIFSLWLL